MQPRKTYVDFKAKTFAELKEIVEKIEADGTMNDVGAGLLILVREIEKLKNKIAMLEKGV